MVISNRLSKIEQTVDARLRALMTPVDQFERDYDFMQRVSEYVGGLPILPREKQIAQWQQSQAKAARMQLATGCTEGEAALQLFVESTSYCLTKEEACKWLIEFGELRRVVVRDMKSGLPAEQSEAAKQMRANLLKAKQVGG